MSTWYLYILRCNDDSLYTGIATDVERRFALHDRGLGAKYLRGRGPLRKEFSVKVGSRSKSLRLEYLIKRLTKLEKELIITRKRLPALPRCRKGKGRRP
jgi:putative endonuclease